MITLRGNCPSPLNMVATASANDGSFEGYLVIYNTPTADYRRLIVSPGAFAAAKPEDVRLLWQHDECEPVGIWTKFEERNRGLYVWGQANLAVQRGAEAYALMQQGGLDGISAGWRAIKYKVPENDSEGITTIEGRLMEASLVTFPAFEDARVHKACDGGDQVSPRIQSLIDIAFGTSCIMRAKADTDLEIRKFESALRDAGLVSKSEANRIGSLVKADPRFARIAAARRDDEAEAQSAREAEDQLSRILRNLQG